MFKETSEGLEQIEMARKRFQKFSTNESTVPSIKFPKLIENPDTMQQLLQDKKELKHQERLLRNICFTRQSMKSIMSHMHEHLKNILHRHGAFFGDVT